MPRFTWNDDDSSSSDDEGTLLGWNINQNALGSTNPMHLNYRIGGLEFQDYHTQEQYERTMAQSNRLNWLSPDYYQNGNQWDGIHNIRNNLQVYNQRRPAYRTNLRRLRNNLRVARLNNEGISRARAELARYLQTSERDLNNPPQYNALRELANQRPWYSITNDERVNVHDNDMVDISYQEFVQAFYQGNLNLISSERTLTDPLIDLTHLSDTLPASDDEMYFLTDDEFEPISD